MNDEKVKIGGLLKTTLLDFPGHVAATVFTAGCNFDCSFCHNQNLIPTDTAASIYSEDDILTFLAKRKNVLGGVCISGGEPTIQAGLTDLIRRIREMGYPLKLDTNGYYPDVLASLLDEALLDYIAMDIKSDAAGYAAICGREDIELERIEKAVALIIGSGIAYEFRTTVIKEFHDFAKLLAIGEFLAEADVWYLQSYQDSEQKATPTLSSYTDDELTMLAERLKAKGITNVKVRGE
ncbi:MAG: anaerobic ribonucleoside-triphosphate reductase activating protein [Lachnospiraceae bacterium]|nr:anaerobic ribonucleoside-triphosphate reductase activating protein [Lachnospiraceae bacterium]